MPSAQATVDRNAERIERNARGVQRSRPFIVLARTGFVARAVTYGVLFGTGYGLGLGPVFGLVSGLTHGVTLAWEFARAARRGPKPRARPCLCSKAESPSAATRRRTFASVLCARRR